MKERVKNVRFEYSYYEPINGKDSNDDRLSDQLRHNVYIAGDRLIELNHPAHWSQDGMLSKETGFCNKECEGVMLVQPACVSDKTNEVVDEKLCHGKPQTTPPKYIPCNTHCKYT